MSKTIAVLPRATISWLAAEPDHQYRIPAWAQSHMNEFTSAAEDDEDRERLHLLVLTDANPCSGLDPHICIDPLLKVKSELQKACVLNRALTL